MSTPQSGDVPNGFDQRLYQRQALQNNPLNTIPQNKAYAPHGSIPNTPLAASVISFLLGVAFSPAFISFILAAFGFFAYPYYQLGFFVAAWTAFHWGEFAVTAGWNLEKCSVDCDYDLIHLRYYLYSITFHYSFLVGKWEALPYRIWGRNSRISIYTLPQTGFQDNSIRLNNG